MTYILNRLHYNYSLCIDEIQTTIINVLDNNVIDPTICAHLQLLSISLYDIDTYYFIPIKFLLNYITSFLASLCNRTISDDDYFILLLFEYIIFIMINVLIESYNEIALMNEQEFTTSQINYILGGYMVLLEKTNYNMELKKNNNNMNGDLLEQLSKLSDTNDWLKLGFYM